MDIKMEATVKSREGKYAFVHVEEMPSWKLYRMDVPWQIGEVHETEIVKDIAYPVIPDGVTDIVIDVDHYWAKKPHKFDRHDFQKAAVTRQNNEWIDQFGQSRGRELKPWPRHTP